MESIHCAYFQTNDYTRRGIRRAGFLKLLPTLYSVNDNDYNNNSKIVNHLLSIRNKNTRCQIYINASAVLFMPFCDFSFNILFFYTQREITQCARETSNTYRQKQHLKVPLSVNIPVY